MKRLALGIGALSALMLFAAGGCGSAPAASTTGGSSSGSSSSSSPVHTGTATVGGTSETVLTDTSGMTLYYFSKDSSTSSACTKGCAATWPPLLSKTPKVSAPAGLSGTLTVVKDQNGQQVAYQGHLLYTYAADSSVGQATGQGLANAWWVATPTLKAAGGTSYGGGY